jgi:hypothetical protein
MMHTMVELIHKLCFLYRLADISKNNIVTNESSDVNHDGINLKEGTFIDTTFIAAKLCDNPDEPCYILCRDVSFTNDPMSRTLHPVVPNLLPRIIDIGRASRTTPI